jgi:hypothetical protein
MVSSLRLGKKYSNTETFSALLLMHLFKWLIILIYLPSFHAQAYTKINTRNFDIELKKQSDYGCIQLFFKFVQRFTLRNLIMMITVFEDNIFYWKLIV